jgi:hypothetical protein
VELCCLICKNSSNKEAIVDYTIVSTVIQDFGVFSVQFIQDFGVFRVQFIQDFGVFMVQFRQDFGIFRVQFIQVSLYISFVFLLFYPKPNTIKGYAKRSMIQMQHVDKGKE